LEEEAATQEAAQAETQPPIPPPIPNPPPVPCNLNLSNSPKKSSPMSTRTNQVIMELEKEIKVLNRCTTSLMLEKNRSTSETLEFPQLSFKEPRLGIRWNEADSPMKTDIDGRSLQPIMSFPEHPVVNL
jgi:hypothetical protein